MSRAAMAAAALAALLTALLAGCGGPDRELGALQWQDSQLQGQNDELQKQLTLLRERLDGRHAEERAADWAFACDYAVSMCPPATVAEGRAVIARDGEPAMDGWLATLLALKALLAALLFGATMIGAEAAVRQLHVHVLEDRAEEAKVSLASAVPAELLRIREAARAAAEAAEVRCHEAEVELDQVSASLEAAQTRLSALQAEIEQREDILRMTGGQFN